MNQPNEIQALRDALPGLAPKDVTFALSLLQQAGAKGLSDKQLFWVRKLATPKAAAPAPVAIGSIRPIVALIENAKSRLKWPTLLLGTDAATLRISVAGPASKAPGSINVTENERGQDGRRPWVGRITTDGTFDPSPRLTPDELQATASALRCFAEDPAGVAAAFGHRTGKCCFCGKQLDDPTSTAVGFGPVCAKNWGLAHKAAA